MTNKNFFFIFTCEKIFEKDNKFYCENIDIKTIVEGLSVNNNIIVVSRFTKNEKKYHININKIYSLKNFFLFFLKIFGQKKRRFLFIDIHPFNFIFFLIGFFIKKKNFLFLRSDGFKEYEYILGKKWVWIYNIMFYIMTKSSSIISCNELLSKGKSQYLIKPSELEKEWFENKKKPNLENPKLLYVGRVKPEKGIFSLVDILKSERDNLKLTIVGDGDISKLQLNNQIISKGFINESSELIKEYDENNIFILPSFTEAQPKVIYEALARKRPVIIFPEITHVLGNLKGVFVSRREYKNLNETVHYILKNYSKIQLEIEKNNLPSKEMFLNDFIKFLNK